MTSEQLDALPVNSIVRLSTGPAFWKINDDEWLGTGSSQTFWAEEIPVPVSTIYTPEETK